MRWVAAFAVAAVVAVAWTQYRVLAVAETIAQLKDALMQTLTARWKEADGTEHVVVTPREPGEAADAHMARHVESVKLGKAAFPPATR